MSAFAIMAVFIGNPSTGLNTHIRPERYDSREVALRRATASNNKPFVPYFYSVISAKEAHP